MKLYVVCTRPSSWMIKANENMHYIPRWIFKDMKQAIEHLSELYCKGFSKEDIEILTLDHKINKNQKQIGCILYREFGFSYCLFDSFCNTRQELDNYYSLFPDSERDKLTTLVLDIR